MPGGGKNSSAPQAPNPQFVAQQQTGTNVQTAWAQQALNQVNQETPYGSLTWSEGPLRNVGGYQIPSYTATQTLSPEQQRLYDTTQGIYQATADIAKNYTGRIGEATKDPYSYAGLPQAPTFNEGYVQKATDAIIGRNQSQMDRDRAALEAQLTNQGISRGTEAWQSGLDDYQRGVNDFRLGAQTQGMQQASQLFQNEGLTRDRAVQEYAAQRSQPINEVSALLGLGQVQQPNFVNTPQSQVAPTDVGGIYANNYAGQMAAYQQQQQSGNAAMGGLFGLGGTALSAGLKYGLPLLAASDVRVKENIRHVGRTNDGQNLYSFNYKGDSEPRVGLMAQEVEKRDPGAVVEIDGLKMVDYGRALSNA